MHLQTDSACKKNLSQGTLSIISICQAPILRPLRCSEISISVGNLSISTIIPEFYSFYFFRLEILKLILIWYFSIMAYTHREIWSSAVQSIFLIQMNSFSRNTSELYNSIQNQDSSSLLGNPSCIKNIDGDGEQQGGQTPVILQYWSKHRFLFSAIFVWQSFSLASRLFT